MAAYADRLNTLALVQELRGSAGRDDISDTDIEKLVATVFTVADIVGPLFSRISHTFKQYTEHDIGHCCNIIYLIGRFIPKSVLHRLNGLELAILILSVLLHDSGMVVSDDEKRKALESESFRMFFSNHHDRWLAAGASHKAGQHYKARAIEDAMLAEYFRRLHPDRARSFARRNLQDKLFFRDIEISSFVLQVSESHSWGVHESNAPNNLDKAVMKLDTASPICGVSVNLQYLACCLRLGDIMDFDRSRTPVAVFQVIDFTESKSWEEWNKHLQISGWLIDESQVLFAAKCAHPAFYVAVMQFLDSIDFELRQCRKLIVNDAPRGIAEKYILSLVPVVDRSKVEMADKRYVAGAFRFQLDYERILELLMDKSLYPDPSLFLRELLQNSLDACRSREAIAKLEGSGDWYKPRIIVWDYCDDHVDPRVVFQDNGVGMSLKIIEDYFMQVGRSYYRSVQFDAERQRLKNAGIELEASSCFGIGILSCFLVADRFEVETYRVGAKPLHITIEGPTKYFIVQLLEEPARTDFPSTAPSDSEDGPPNRPGTRITIHLHHDSKTDVLQVLRKLAVNLEYDLSVYAPGITVPQTIPRLGWDSRSVDVRELARAVGEQGSFQWIEEPGWILIEPSNSRPKLAKNLARILVASSIPLHKYDFSCHFRGRAWLWFLKDERGKACPARGYLRLHDEISLIGLPRMLGYATRAFAEERISDDSCERFVNALKGSFQMDFDEFETSEAFTSLVDIYQEDGEFRELFDPETTATKFAKIWAELSPSERQAAYLALKAHKRSAPDWFEVPGVPEMLARRSLDWARLSINFHKPLKMCASPHRFALHGILVQAGLVKWDPTAAYARKLRLLSAPGGLRLDARGIGAPTPAASRLFVEFAEAEKVAVPFARATLRYAAELAARHLKDWDWQAWFTSFINLTTDLLFWPEAIRQEIRSIERVLRYKICVSGELARVSHDTALKRFGRWVPISVGYGKEATDGLIVDYPPMWLLAFRPKRKRSDATWEIDFENTMPSRDSTLHAAYRSWDHDMEENQSK